MKKVWLLMILGISLTVGCTVSEGIDAGVDFNSDAAFTTEMQSGEMVKLYYAEHIQTGFWSYKVVGYIQVRDLGFDKEVDAHFALFGCDYWQDVSAEYVCTAEDGTEVWKFEILNLDYRMDPEDLLAFAVRYRVNGSEYWDNNYGADYVMSTDDRVIYGQSMLNLEYAYCTEGPDYNPYPPQFSVYVDVRDLAYDKAVTVVYSTNDWETVLEGRAVYQYECADGAEQWYYGVTFDSSVESIDFAIKYEVGGMTGWDNNFGSDYHIEGCETIY